MKRLLEFYRQLRGLILPRKELSVSEKVEYSLKKYGKTYKLLEEYDTKAIRDPEVLAGPGRLRPYLREMEGPTRV